jgi:hypothetical protein
LLDGLQNLESGRRYADCIECVVDSAGVDRPNRIDCVSVRGIDDMGRAEFSGELQLTVDQVHRDNGVSAGNGGGADRRQPDASGTEYRH